VKSKLNQTKSYNEFWLEQHTMSWVPLSYYWS
jgi:hypothetical protein